MKQLMMMALLAAFVMPAFADDMNPTDTRAEFAARKANHGKYVPPHHHMMGKHHMGKHHMAKPVAKKHMGKKAK